MQRRIDQSFYIYNGFRDPVRKLSIEKQYGRINAQTTFQRGLLYTALNKLYCTKPRAVRSYLITVTLAVNCSFRASEHVVNSQEDHLGSIPEGNWMGPLIPL